MLDGKFKSILDRVEAKFEKESGWKSKDVKGTLQNFSRLNRVNQALFGGLLVGRALFRPGATDVAPRARRKHAEPVTVS